MTEATGKPTGNKLAESAARQGTWYTNRVGYVLRSNGRGPSTEVALTEAEFNEIKLARSLLFDALASEQKSELVLSNWLALAAVVVDGVATEGFFRERLHAGRDQAVASCAKLNGDIARQPVHRQNRGC